MWLLWGHRSGPKTVGMPETKGQPVGPDLHAVAGELHLVTGAKTQVRGTSEVRTHHLHAGDELGSEGSDPPRSHSHPEAEPGRDLGQAPSPGPQPLHSGQQ